MLTLEPAEGEVAAECWTVAFGNLCSSADRCVAAGYDNGDVKLFDMRMSTLRWEGNVSNGVCHVAFDRQDIALNKLAVSCLGGNLLMYDLTTYHPEEGYACKKGKVCKSTLWCSKFLPQNREVFASCGGAGGIHLYKYEYPEQRKLVGSDGLEKGVAGGLQPLNKKEFSSQPAVAFDWHPDKLGLAASCFLDQQIRILLVTKLNFY